MDRDEILRRSREGGEDEGDIFAENRGRRFGVVGFSLMFAVLQVFDLITGQASHNIRALFWCYVSLESWGRYRISSGRILLATAVLSAMVSLCDLACYVLEVLR